MPEPHYNAGMHLRDYLKPYLRLFDSHEKRHFLHLSKGLLQCRSAILSRAGRAVLGRMKGKTTVLHSRLDNWVKRMSNFLGDLPWEQMRALHWKRLRRRQQSWKYVIHDTSDIAKPWAEKMEGLSVVRDGSTGELVNGYVFCQSVGVGSVPWDIHPIDCALMDPAAEDFTCAADVFKEQIRRMILSGIGWDVLHIFDRGFDDEKWFSFLDALEIAWLIRLKHNRRVIFRGEEHLLSSVTETLLSEGQRSGELVIGSATVGVPLKSKKNGEGDVLIREYTFVVIQRPQYVHPMMLLLNGKVENVREASSLYCSYLDRWEVEDYLRFAKQALTMETMRLMKYHKLQNLLRLQMLLTDYLLREYAEGRTPIGSGLFEVLQVSYVAKKDTRILSPYVVAQATADLLTAEQRYGYQGVSVPAPSFPVAQMSLFTPAILDTLID